MSLRSLLAHGAPMAPGSVSLVQGTPDATDPYAGAETNLQTGVITAQPGFDAFGRAHEVGHLFDARVLNDGQRQRIEGLLGMKGPWDQGTGLTGGGLRSPSERFADWYSAMANHIDVRHQWESTYSPVPNANAYKQFVQLLQTIGRQDHLGRYVAPTLSTG